LSSNVLKIASAVSTIKVIPALMPLIQTSLNQNQVAALAKQFGLLE
jgi:hypothetical protein